MKKTILILALLVAAAFAQPNEHVLSSTEIIYRNTFDRMVECDLDLRYVTERSIKGTWLDIEHNDRVLINMDGPVKDSILTYIAVYQKWAMSNEMCQSFSNDIKSIATNKAKALQKKQAADEFTR